MADVEAPAPARIAPPIDVPTTLANIITQLQKDPVRYKLFGVWWWPIKLFLIRAGYSRKQLYMLGRYQDPITSALVPKADLQGTMRAALTEYVFNATYGRAGGMVETPDGEIVKLHDEDANL